MSALRCEATQLARVAHVADEYAVNRNRIVRCLESYDSDGVPMWRYSGHLEMPDGERCDGIADICLDPIRSPGADEVDESAAWYPAVPTDLPERTR